MTSDETDYMGWWQFDFRLFMEQQQPLGAEFQKVLDENRWELYERSGE